MTQPNQPTPEQPASPPAPTPPRAIANPRGYWRANLTVILILLTVWAAVSFGLSIVLIEPLNRYKIGGVPLGFWFSQQGSIYVFVALILVYALVMDRIDRKYGVNE